MKKKVKKKTIKRKKKKNNKIKIRRRIKKRRPPRKKFIKNKKKKKNRISFKTLKSKRSKKPKGPLRPFDRIKKIKISKIKLKQIKIPKFKIKKKQIYKIKKKASQATKIRFQKIVNFILTPFFRAYDNYVETKKIKRIAKIAFDKKENDRKKREEERYILETKQRELKYEEKLARERSIDLKKFIRQEQAILRREQAEKRRKFLEEIKLNKKIQAFRKRELEEIKNLEKVALKEQRDDYRFVEERLFKIKEKYRLIREQKIRERVQALGLEITDADTKEDILQKEREYAEHRHTIELVLESFYRSANSLVFQLNKRYIPKHKSILRVIDRRYESNECFIRYDDSSDEDWLILIYLEDSDAKKGKIVVENKSNPEKNETKIFEQKEIFTYSDYLVDAMTSHIDRVRKKNNK